MHVHLRSSALLAMTKLMAIEPAFCEANLPLLFTLLEKRSADLQPQPYLHMKDMAIYRKVLHTASLVRYAIASWFARSQIHIIQNVLRVLTAAFVISTYAES